MTPGTCYRLTIKRRGLGRPVIYHGRFVARHGETLVFSNLENLSSIRIHESVMDTEPQELDDVEVAEIQTG